MRKHHSSIIYNHEKIWAAFHANFSEEFGHGKDSVDLRLVSMGEANLRLFQTSIVYFLKTKMVTHMFYRVLIYSSDVKIV